MTEMSARPASSLSALSVCGPAHLYAVPHLAVQARIELFRVHLALSDLAGVRTLPREIDELLCGPGSRKNAAPAFPALRLDRRRTAHRAATATHLSYPEIATELFLSKHTIKLQAHSLYRKLGATSRRQAVTRSRTLALLDE